VFADGPKDLAWAGLTFTGMRAFGAVAGLEGGRAEGGLDVALGGPGLANPEGPGRLSEGGKLGSLGDGGVAPMVRLTEVRYEGAGREAP